MQPQPEDGSRMEEDEEESTIFPNLINLEAEELGVEAHKELRHYVVLRRLPGVELQLSRPHHIVQPPKTERVPPVSIGFAAMAERFNVFWDAGLIPGTGMWPAPDDDEDSDEEMGGAALTVTRNQRTDGGGATDGLMF